MDEHNGEEPKIEKTMNAKALELFIQRKTIAEVVVILNLEYVEAKHLYLQYLDS